MMCAGKVVINKWDNQVVEILDNCKKKMKIKRWKVKNKRKEIFKKRWMLMI